MENKTHAHDIECKRIFLCSPYAGDTVENYILANEYMDCVRYYGQIPLAPHCLYPQAFPEHIKGNREFGMKCSFSILEHWAQELWFVRGKNGISSGMQQEIDFASRLGKPVKDMTKLARKFVEDKKERKTHERY